MSRSSTKKTSFVFGKPYPQPKNKLKQDKKIKLKVLREIPNLKVALERRQWENLKIKLELRLSREAGRKNLKLKLVGHT